MPHGCGIRASRDGLTASLEAVIRKSHQAKMAIKSAGAPSGASKNDTVKAAAKQRLFYCYTDLIQRTTDIVYADLSGRRRRPRWLTETPGQRPRLGGGGRHAGTITGLRLRAGRCRFSGFSAPQNARRIRAGAHRAKIRPGVSGL